MKRFVSLSFLLLSLAACGADGEPVRPTASAGVTIGSDGVHSSATVGVVKGPLTIGLSL